MSLPSTYDEPTVMWRMRRGTDRYVQAVVDPTGSSARVVWLLDGTPVGVRYFNDWRTAIEWSDRLKMQYWTVGWRLVDEVPQDEADEVG